MPKNPRASAHSVRLSRLFVVASLLASGCSSSVIPAHELDAVVAYDNLTTRAVLAFPARDPEASNTPPASSCSWSHGECGRDAPTDAAIQGDGTPIVKATFTTLSNGESGTYDIAITRTPQDDAAYLALTKARGAVPREPAILCRVYDSQLATPQPCFYSSRPVLITLTRR